MLIESITEAQHAQAQRSRVRTIAATVTAGVLWLAALLPTVLPQVNELLPPKAQKVVSSVAGIITAVAAFLAKDSGASAIPHPKGDPPDSERSIGIGSR